MTIINRTAINEEHLSIPEPEIGQWVILCDAHSIATVAMDVRICEQANQPYVVYELLPGERGEYSELFELMRRD